MKATVTYKRNNPDTIVGDSISVTITYSDFDGRKIDKIHEYYKQFGMGYSFEVPDEEDTNDRR